MNLILNFIAIVLFCIIEPFNFVYVVFIKKKFSWERLSGYFRTLAVGIDRFGNHHFHSLFNKLFIVDGGYEFGNFNETVSSALGKNQHFGKLSNTGKLLVAILDFLDKDHCLKSMNWNI